MKIEKMILVYATNNSKLSDLSKDINYSTKQVCRLCKKHFNHTYKELQFLMITAEILKLKLAGKNAQFIADVYFNGDISQLYQYITRFSDVPLKKIIIGGHRMTNNQKKIMEAQVITMLVNNSTGKNISLKKLNVPRCIIISLRAQGYDIISVPGRYNGGYNLGKTSKSACLNWINNIRTNRYNLPANYSF